MKKRQSSELYGIIGLGRFGFALAETLAGADKEILVVDKDEALVRRASAFTENAFIVGALNQENLQSVGIQNCDVVVVCIGAKVDVSILTTLIVLQLGVKRVISKATNAEQGCVLEKIGAEVVYPERDMGVRLANRLMAPALMEYISLSDEVDISEIRLPERFNSKSVLDLNLRKRYGLNIIAVKQNGEISIDIGPKLILSANDIIVVIGTRVNIRSFEDSLLS
ncbi:MAG: TrkA family potassium uptake protein [Clostridia bacterium]|nr:TrkA family potassium uptake protein [Clostridia bacterium]